MALLQDSQRFKQHLAKKFAANYTPRRALLHMADAEIPPEQRPDLTAEEQKAYPSHFKVSCGSGPFTR